MQPEQTPSFPSGPEIPSTAANYSGQNAQVNDTHQQQSDKPHKSKRKIIVALIVAIAIVVIVPSIIATIHANEINAAIGLADNFVQDVSSGKSNDAYTLSAPVLKQSTSLNDFTNDVQLLDAHLTSKPQKTEWTTVSQSGNPSEIQVDFTASGTNGTSNIKVTLYRINGNWQVVGFNFSGL